MENKFWKMRADKYNDLHWVNNEMFINDIVNACECSFADLVLEVGVGTGVIAKHISPYVHKVIGIDVSSNMLKQGKLWEGEEYGNIFVMRWDARRLPFDDNIFNTVVSRHTFHHIIENTHIAMDECYRVLRPGGRVVVAEGQPPSLRTRNDFIEIFKLKEERIVLFDSDIKKMMLSSGFKNVSSNILVLPHMSVRNWVESSGIEKTTQDKIIDMHMNASNEFKIDYNMDISGNDCFIDMTMCIVKGTK